MKRILTIIIMGTILLSLIACSNANLSAVSTEELAEANISTDVVKEYSMNFDSVTNKTIIFQNVSIQIPDSWYCHQQDEEYIFWLPEYDSDTEYAQIYLMVLGRWGYSQESIHAEELQSNIKNAVAERFLDGIDNVIEIESSIGKANTQYYLYSVEGIHQTESKIVSIKVSTYNFVVNDKLYMLLYQSSSEDSFDYSVDVLSAIGSVSENIEPLPTENVEIEAIETTRATETILDDMSDSQITDIGVRFITDLIDNDGLHLKVYTKNNSKNIFSGNVYVTFYSADGEDKLGSDTILVENLQPGQESWANVIIDAYRGTPKMAVDFSEVTFTPLEEVTAEIDQETTQKVKRSYELNFEGVSWYNDITEIEVFTDGSCIITIHNNSKEGGQFYANAIWQCGSQYGVDTVKVVDTNGNVKAVY